MSNLVGKNILIVDEVDDTRTTLEYAVRELQKDVETARKNMGGGAETRFSIFVLHVSFDCIDFLLFFCLVPVGLGGIRQMRSRLDSLGLIVMA